MPVISKFDGYVVNPARARSVVTPAYDAMLPSERREFAEKYPDNYVNVMRTLEEYPDSPPTLNEILEYNKYHFNLLMANDVYEKTASPSYFLYRLRAGGHEQTGLIADMPVSDFVEGKLKKHEDTQIEKENMLVRYQQSVGVTSSPICVAYADTDEISEAKRDVMGKAPILDFSAWDDVEQTIWRVDDLEVERQLQRSFEDIEYTYLTDGHHRSASAVRFAKAAKQKGAKVKGSKADQMFVALFPKSQLRIYSYFRCVRDLNGLEHTQFLSAIESAGIRVEPRDLQDADQLLPSNAREVTMIVNQQVYSLQIPQSMVPQDDPAGSLDVSVLQQRVLSPILGIRDARSDQRLNYIPGVEGMAGLIERCRKNWQVGFACVDTAIQEVIDVADAGQVMPPKSTWFDPKLRAGIFVRYC
ncbi:MAG: DUF1015 family protein [Acidiferrobacterales bacterium]|nr:DUF1015 family protein [Acidiferrobacterales bacterium]